MLRVAWLLWLSLALSLPFFLKLPTFLSLDQTRRSGRDDGSAFHFSVGFVHSSVR